MLIERSKLRERSEPAAVKPPTASPEHGHDTSRAGMGVGWRGNDLVTQVSLRVGYHDLLDPDAGHGPSKQIELLAATLRYYTEREQFRLERFTLADVISLSPMDALFKAPSWKASAGLETVRDDHDRLFSNWNVNGGLGAAFETRWLGREVYFAFAEADANYSDAYTDNHRVGGGGTAGVLLRLTDRWKLLATGTYLGYPIGDQSDDARGFVGLRYTLQRNWAMRFEFEHRDHDDQGVFTVQAFF